MRNIILVFSLLCMSPFANAAYYTWYSSFFNVTAGSPQAVCDTIDGVNNNLSGFVFTNAQQTQAQCLSNAGNPVSSTNMVRNGTGCQPNYIYNSTTGGCEPPPPDPCASKAGQQTEWTKEYNSKSEYDANPVREVTSQGGCGVTDLTLECATSGDTGKFGCWGTGTYTGDSLVDSDGSGVEECGESCEPKPPVTSTQTQNCTPNDNGSFTCTSTSGSTQYAPSECAMGTVNGVTGYHCVKADYVPGSATNTREDVVTTTDNGDGTTTTNTTSTTNNTHCKAGECTTTTTTTTTSTTKDAEGNTLNETKDCTGPNCDKPVDETGEGEDEEGAKFGGSGGCEDGNCAVDAFNPFGQDVIPGFGETTQNIYNGIGNSPIVQAAVGIEFPTGGSCSSYSLTLFDKTITSDHHCQAWSQFSGSLSAIFLAIWAFAAVRVFLSA